MKQLHYQLLENEADLEDRITQLKEQLREHFDMARRSVGNSPNYGNFKELNNVIRHASGLVNEHEKVTKDKLSEVECRLFILKQTFSYFPILFEPSTFTSAFKLSMYVKGRMKNALSKYDKLHEDLQFDLHEEMDYILAFAATHNLD